jgi:ornithine cyclodeaminase
VILSADNVVDDIDHVCRAQTSVHLAEQKVNHRNFIHCTLADLLSGSKSLPDNSLLTVFSPFGLGILDIAVARHVYHQALKRNLGTVVPGFFPEPWTRTKLQHCAA